MQEINDHKHYTNYNKKLNPCIHLIARYLS